MLNLYNPISQAFFSSTGQSGVSPQILELNVLIELRVANMLQVELAKGNFNVSLDELRAAVVTETLNTA